MTIAAMSNSIATLARRRGRRATDQSFWPGQATRPSDLAHVSASTWARDAQPAGMEPREPGVPLWGTKPQGAGLSATTTLPPNLRPDTARCRSRPLAMNGPDAAARFCYPRTGMES